MQLRFRNETAVQGSAALSSPLQRPAKKRRFVPRPHLEKIGGMERPVRDFLQRFIDLSARNTFVLRTSIVESISGFSIRPAAVVNLKRMNDVRALNRFLSEVNHQLEDNGTFVVCLETKYFRKKRILNNYPVGLNYGLLLTDYLVKRVLPKLPVSSRVLRMVYGDRDKAMSKTEALGRLYAAGFEVVDKKFINGLLYLVTRKVKAPLFDYEKNYGPIFCMRRSGKNGKVIRVYKLRTMHAYSEFIQQYVYEQNSLADGGKLKNDFRVSTLGRIVRKYWLDELPMVWNLFRGDLKLVGVRPLSSQYLSLYSDELKMKRNAHKPGLVPPFYADMPKTIDEIQASELRYLEAHEKSPFLTDLRYFMKATWNILVKRARSK